MNTPTIDSLEDVFSVNNILLSKVQVMLESIYLHKWKDYTFHSLGVTNYTDIHPVYQLDDNGLENVGDVSKMSIAITRELEGHELGTLARLPNIQVGEEVRVFISYIPMVDIDVS